MDTTTDTDTSRISVSAHYTGYIWFKNDMSHAGFVTPMGRTAYWALRPVNSFLQLMVGASIDTFLLQRHIVLDHLVTQAIEKEGYEQIVELAAGLSSRGYLIKQKYPQVKYIEGDLPGMSSRKAQLLDETGRAEGHITVPCNILDEAGEQSIEHLMSTLDKTKKTLVITEGLVNYFELPVIRRVWSRLATELKQFPEGRYITEVYPELKDHPSFPYVRMAQKIVGFFTRGEYPLHYGSDLAMQKGFEQDGYQKVRVSEPEAFYGTLDMPVSQRRSLVRIVEAIA